VKRDIASVLGFSCVMFRSG